MARRLIGLDIGTNAVRVAELEATTPARLVSFGQVALPLEAMRDGEVVDPGAVTDAIKRLWRELKLGRGEVRVGLASPRVIVRSVEMPAMPETDLESALRFQAEEQIALPLEDAVLSFQVLEPIAAPAAGGESGLRVLVVAAHNEAVRPLVSAVRAAGLRVRAVDLVPLALIRSIGQRVSDNGPGAEALVSMGAGTTVVVVHEDGLPRFVRILGLGGRGLTEVIARDLDISFDEAEALKRQSADAPADQLERARAAIARPRAALLEEVRGSLDYYRTQPGAARVLRVQVTGGSSLLPGIEDDLSRIVDLPVDLAEPRARLQVGDIGFPQERFPQLDPYLAVPVGIALGGLSTGRRINLIPGGAAASGYEDRRRVLVAAGAVAAGLVIVLGGLTLARNNEVNDAEEQATAQEAENARLEQQINALNDVAATQREIQASRAQLASILATDVSWSRMLQEVARTIPADVWLTAFQGSVTTAAAASGGTTGSTAAPGTAATPTSGPSGTVSFTAVGLTYPSVSAWLQRIATIPSFTNLWVPSAAQGELGAREVVNFPSSADLTAKAISDRLAQLQASQTPGTGAN